MRRPSRIQVILIKCVLLYIQFHTVYYNQTWNDSRPTCTDFNQHAKLTLPANLRNKDLWLHLTFISPISTRLGRIVEQEMMTSPQLGNITNIYGFVFTFLSPIVIILGREFHRHELKLASTWIRISYLFKNNMDAS